MKDNLEKTVKVLKKDICIIVSKGLNPDDQLLAMYHKINDQYQRLLERFNEEERSTDYLRRGWK